MSGTHVTVPCFADTALNEEEMLLVADLHEPYRSVHADYPATRAYWFGLQACAGGVPVPHLVL
jgi:hypothetical protein